MSGMHVIPRLLCRRSLCTSIRGSNCIHGSFPVLSMAGMRLSQNLSVMAITGVTTPTENKAVQLSPIPGAMLISVRHMAGHSHWANIRHTKGAADEARATFIAKMVKQMQIVAKEGGSPDPKKNKKLADLVYSLEKQSLPKATIQKTLKRLANTGDAQTIYMEVRGPLGSVFVLELFTAQMKRCKDEILSLMKKTVGRTSDSPAWQHVFDQQGVVTVPVTADMNTSSTDEYVEIAIEAGAEDVILTEEQGEPVLKFHCSAKQIASVAKEIEQTYDLKVSSHVVELVPLVFVTLEDPADIEACQKIISRAEEHEDIVRVFDNITVPED